MKAFVLIRTIYNPNRRLDYEIDSIIGVYADEGKAREMATYLNHQAWLEGFTRVTCFVNDYEVIDQANVED